MKRFRSNIYMFYNGPVKAQNLNSADNVRHDLKFYFSLTGSKLDTSE